MQVEGSWTWPRRLGIGVLLLALAVVSAGGGVLLVQRALERSATAQGLVVGIEQREGEDGTEYRAIVEFRAGDQRRRFADSIWRSPAGHRVDELVDVAYDPQDPADATIASGLRTVGRWLGVIGLGALSLVLLLAAWSAFLGGR